MDVLAVAPYVQTARPFVDGFGERYVTVDAEGDRTDVLRVSTGLSAVPSFEAAVRQQAARLAGFRHASYGRVRSIEIDGSTGTLLVVSDHVRGVRLSTLLASAEKRSVPLAFPAAAALIRQLVLAASDWRDAMPDVVHGAIGPERIVIAPGGKLILVEHVLGAALERLPYSRQRFWEELGVALPRTFTPSIDARADVLQVGAVALALVAGRPLNATERLDDVYLAISGDLVPSFHAWLPKALQIDPAGAFASVIDARTTLEEALGPPQPEAERDALLHFMARCLTLELPAAPCALDESASEVAGVIPGADDLPEVDLGTRIEALRAFLEPRQARARPAEAHSPAPPPFDAPAMPDRQWQSVLGVTLLSRDWRRRLWLAGATAVAVVGAVVLLAAGLVPWSRGSSTGVLSIDTRPAGVAVTIDGAPRGVTPLSVDLAAGEHVVELVTNTERRRVPVMIRAGGESSQFLEMAAASLTSAPGELRIRTEPLAASVTVDGRYVGQSPVSVGDLSPGSHTVVLKHETGSATEQVLIEPGKTASLFVPLAPRGAAGWISVNAPVDLQLFENGRFLGSSRIERIMMPAGRHELELVNEALGFRERRTIQVTAGQTAAVAPKWPTGSLSINAVPWAQAFVDGDPVGETPIANIPVPIGVHEIVFRHPQLGERTASVTVTATETAKVGIDLRAK